MLAPFFLKIFCKILDKCNTFYYLCSINNAQNNQDMKNRNQLQMDMAVIFQAIEWGMTPTPESCDMSKVRFKKAMSQIKKEGWPI